MTDVLSSFGSQFTCNLSIEHGGSLSKYASYVVAGMGGSQAGAGILKTAYPRLFLLLHQDFGLPLHMPQDGSTCLIASSYSGTTEETLSSFREALATDIPVAVVATKGELLELARYHKVPHIVIPDIGAPPRFARWVSSRAIALLMGETAIAKELESVGASMNVATLENRGRELGEKMADRFPLLLSSGNLSLIASYWEMTLAETAKVLSSSGVIPEFAHNHMAAWGMAEQIQRLAPASCAVIFQDREEDERIQKRLRLVSSLLEEQELPVHIVEGESSSFLGRVMELGLLGDWASIALAEHYGLDPQDVSVISELKRRMAS